MNSAWAHAGPSTPVTTPPKTSSPVIQVAFEIRLVAIGVSHAAVP